MLDLASSDSIEPGGPLLFWTTVETLRWVLPMLAAGFVVSLAAGFAQGGFVFAPEALCVQVRSGSAPRAGCSNSFRSPPSAPFSNLCCPLQQLLWVGIASIRSHWQEILASSYVDAHRFAALLCSILLELFWKSGLIFLVWAGVDYMLLWWKNEGELKMSRQDLRDEMKQTEGSPETKARIRRIQRQTPAQADAQGD